MVVVDAADGRNLVLAQPAEDTFYASVAWMPSGTRLLFSRYVPGAGYRLFGVDADGSALSRIRVGSHVLDADASPDGTRIAYTDRRSRLGVANVDGSGAQLIATDAFDPAWSSASSTLLFEHVRSGARHSDLYTIAPDGRADEPGAHAEARRGVAGLVPRRHPHRVHQDMEQRCLGRSHHRRCRWLRRSAGHRHHLETGRLPAMVAGLTED